MKQFIVKLSEFVSIVCLIAFIMFVTSEGKISEKTAPEVAESVVSAMNLEGTAEQKAKELKKQFLFDAGEFDSFVYYKSDDVMNVRELLIIRVKDAEQTSDIVKEIEKVLNDKKNLFESYAPEQSALLEKAIIETKQNFIFYAVGEDVSSAYSVFVDSL